MIMRDLPVSTAEAARWLLCTEDEVQAHLQAGRLLPFRGPGAEGKLSLNSVIVLAESLPEEKRIFELRPFSASLDSPPSGPRSSSGPRTGSGGLYGNRPAPIVERRPIRPITPR